MYTFDSRVRYSETDENGNLSLESLIDYMQDCTNFQSEDLGVGLEYHRQKNIMASDDRNAGNWGCIWCT